MSLLLTLGEQDSSISYMQRPTAKIVILHEDKVLIMNGGTLPGGGVDPEEEPEAGAARELREELGATTRSLRPLGTVVQYRNYLSKKYIVYGYVGELVNMDSSLIAREEYEMDFTHEWVLRQDAISYVQTAVNQHKKDNPVHTSDTEQGRLYNLETSLALVTAVCKV